MMDSFCKNNLRPSAVNYLPKKLHQDTLTEQSFIYDSVPAANYIFRVNNRNIGTMCEIYSMLTIKIPDGVFIVNFEHISHFVLVLLLLQVNAGWGRTAEYYKALK